MPELDGEVAVHALPAHVTNFRASDDSNLYSHAGRFSQCRWDSVNFRK
jgi:hypothetical protein